MTAGQPRAVSPFKANSFLRIHVCTHRYSRTVHVTRACNVYGVGRTRHTPCSSFGAKGIWGNEQARGGIWDLGGPCRFLSSDGHASCPPALAGQVQGAVAAGRPSCGACRAEGWPGPARKRCSLPARSPPQAQEAASLPKAVQITARRRRFPFRRSMKLCVTRRRWLVFSSGDRTLVGGGNRLLLLPRKGVRMFVDVLPQTGRARRMSLPREFASPWFQNKRRCRSISTGAFSHLTKTAWVSAAAATQTVTDGQAA